MSILGTIFNFLKKKLIILIIFLLSLFTSTYEETIERNDEISGELDGKLYKLRYNTLGITNEHFINIKEINGVTDVKCDIDHTRLLIVFNSSNYMLEMVNRLDNPPPIFFIMDGTKCDDVLLRRFLKLELIKEENSIELFTTQARYDEIFENAYIDFDMNDIPVCLGVNTDNCNNPKTTLPIYKNQYVDVNCINCFIGFSTNVFFEMGIKSFKLDYIKGGFRNSVVNGALIVDANGKYHWSLSVDKTYPVVKPTTIITFHIGIIPIRIWFEIPIEEKLDLSLDTQADVKLGATMKWNLGSDYMAWNSYSHWQIYHDKPVFSWSPVFESTAFLNSHLEESLNPTFILHVDNLYSFWLMIEPTLIGDVVGSLDKKQICGSLSYDFDVKVKSELDINIPWLHVEYDKTFGPYVIFEESGPIGKICLPK